MSAKQTIYQVLVNDEVVAEFGSGDLMKAREKAMEVNGRVQYVKR